MCGYVCTSYCPFQRSRRKGRWYKTFNRKWLSFWDNTIESERRRHCMCVCIYSKKRGSFLLSLSPLRRANREEEGENVGETDFIHFHSQEEYLSHPFTCASCLCVILCMDKSVAFKEFSSIFYIHSLYSTSCVSILLSSSSPPFPFLFTSFSIRVGGGGRGWWKKKGERDFVLFFMCIHQSSLLFIFPPSLCLTSSYVILNQNQEGESLSFVRSRSQLLVHEPRKYIFLHRGKEEEEKSCLVMILEQDSFWIPSRMLASLSISPFLLYSVSFIREMREGLTRTKEKSLSSLPVLESWECSTTKKERRSEEENEIKQK